jgi:diguanylate cyclase (GGDEF)-like protein/PAS domain S-box-containing protein
MTEQKRVLYAVLICVLIALIASAAGIYLLYSAAIERVGEQLEATVKTQARLIEAVARYDSRHTGRGTPRGEVPQVTLEQIRDSFSQYQGIGNTGEFLLGRRVGDDIVYIAWQRNSDTTHPKIVPRGASMPMQLAISGQSGITIARDYRGVKVLAAYEAIKEFNLGVVAKIDLAEVRAPYQTAAAIAMALAVLTVLLCAFLIVRVTNPIIRRLQASESRVRAIVDSAADAIITIDDKGTVESFNVAAERIFGYAPADVIGRNVKMLMPEPYHSEHDSYLQNYHATGQPKVIGRGCSVTARRKDGSEFHVDLIINEMHADGVRKFVGMVRDTTERVRAQEALRESEMWLKEAQRIAQIGNWSLDLVNNGLRWSDEIYRIFEIDPHEFGASYEAFLDVIHPEDREFVNRAYTGSVKNKNPYNIVHRLRMKDGRVKHVQERCETFYDPAGRPLRSVGTVQDITERMQTEAEMQKLSRALEQTADAVTITDRNGVIEYINPAFEVTTGYRKDEALGRKPSLLKSGKQGPDFYKKLWTTILAGKAFSEVFVNRRKDGSLYYEEKTITPLRDAQGNITHFVATGKDISERVQAQERLQFMAQHDVLTELPNRALFLDRLKQALARARMHRRLVAVLFLDLDRFKDINDTLGHQIGDLLLQEIANRFIKAIRDGDTVARLSGDEFAFLLEDVPTDKDIAFIAEKILESLKPVFLIDGHDLFVSASIGVSLYPNDGEETGTLLRNADVAMYRAKDMGKNNYQFYSADMSVKAFERLSLESSLRRALEREEFLLYYQPQVDVQSGKILGVEALLRWQHPDLGLVMPNDFIALLEENGLIVPVGEWVLRKACAQVRDWHKAGWDHLSVAVNLSARQFNAPGLVEMVERTTSELGFNRERLELEITESVIMRHAQVTIDALETLSRMGVQLAVDDFGTGYSSLSYLRRFPIDTLKIDSSFIRDIPHDLDDSAITTAIIVMAQSLKLKVIAEGVETEEQLRYLREHGCHAMQGYLFSKPLPAEEMTALLKKK